MIAHALTIVRSELEAHLSHNFGGAGNQGVEKHTDIGSVADLSGGVGNGKGRDLVLLSVVNIQEERTLRNLPHYLPATPVEVDPTIRYENPPTYLNLSVLVTATHTDYQAALKSLSRTIAFFQHRNVFTPETVATDSLTAGGPWNTLDELTQFKLVFTLGSPTLEEVNDMWGMLGGKQYPFALYWVRMLELRFRATLREQSAISRIERNYKVINPAG